MEFQRVVAVGGLVKEVKVGDLVHFNPIRYAVMKHKEGGMKDGIITDNPVVDYNVPTVVVNGETCMLVYDSDIDYVVECDEAG